MIRCYCSVDNVWLLFWTSLCWGSDTDFLFVEHCLCMWLGLGALPMSKSHGGQERKQFPLAPWLFSIFLYPPLCIWNQLQASQQPLTYLFSVFLKVNPFFMARVRCSALHDALARGSRKNFKNPHSWWTYVMKKWILLNSVRNFLGKQ